MKLLQNVGWELEVEDPPQALFDQSDMGTVTETGKINGLFNDGVFIIEKRI